VKTSTLARWSVAITAAAIGVMGAAAATTQSAATQSILNAIRKGDCDRAVKQMNAAMGSSDADAVFLAGRMLDEGVCVKQDSAGATAYFKRALDLGDRASALDFGTKIGLGQGAEQNYEQAGEACRDGGLDAERKLSAYSLGYACTVRGVAGMLLRESAPTGAFTGGIAQVQFIPQGAAMHIRSVPNIGLAEVQTGTNVRRPLIDGTAAIEKAWNAALALVPKPDQTKLDGDAIDLPLDVAMTIESGRNAKRDNQGTLLPSDYIPVRYGPNGATSSK
jgi:TPR repeat protein